MVERQPSKLRAAGSTPVSRSIKEMVSAVSAVPTVLTAETDETV